MTEPVSYPAGMRHPEHCGLRLLWAKSFRLQVLWKWVTELQKPWLCQSHQCGFQVPITGSEMQKTQQWSMQHPKQRSRAMALGRKHLCVQPAFLQELQTENGQRDIQQLLCLPSPHQVGENKQSLFFITTFWEGDAGRECQPEAFPDFFHPAFSAQLMAPQHAPPPLLSRAHLHLPKLHSKSARVQGHSKGCFKGHSLPTLSFTPD